MIKFKVYISTNLIFLNIKKQFPHSFLISRECARAFFLFIFILSDMGFPTECYATPLVFDTLPPSLCYWMCIFILALSRGVVSSRVLMSCLSCAKKKKKNPMKHQLLQKGPIRHSGIFWKLYVLVSIYFVITTY